MAKNVRFFLLIHRTSQSEVWSPFPYKGRLIENAVCFEAVAYGEIVRFFGTSMPPSPTGGNGNAVRGVTVWYGEGCTFRAILLAPQVVRSPYKRWRVRIALSKNSEIRRAFDGSLNFYVLLAFSHYDPVRSKAHTANYHGVECHMQKACITVGRAEI